MGAFRVYQIVLGFRTSMFNFMERICGLLKSGLELRSLGLSEGSLRLSILSSVTDRTWIFRQVSVRDIQGP